MKSQVLPTPAPKRPKAAFTAAATSGVALLPPPPASQTKAMRATATLRPRHQPADEASLVADVVAVAVARDRDQAVQHEHRAGEEAARTDQLLRVAARELGLEDVGHLRHDLRVGPLVGDVAAKAVDGVGPRAGVIDVAVEHQL